MRKVLIVGAGTAGLSAAVSLSERGVPSILVERSEILGGRASGFGCKGITECVRCDVCLSLDRVKLAKREALIERVKGASLERLSGRPGDFRAELSSPGFEAGRRQSRVGAVICANGYEPFDAGQEARLGLGRVRGVVSATDVEGQLKRSGAIAVPETGRLPESAAFIMCVGSRDQRLGSQLCSRACCKYSFKMAQLLRAQRPGASITFHYMDWRLNDPRENVRRWAAGQKGVELVRGRPAEVLEGEDGRPTVRFASEGDQRIEERGYDLVILSVGIAPSADNAMLARLLGIELGPDGFMRSLPGDACVSTRAGVFLAGCCQGPKDLTESAKDGAVAAEKAYQFLEAGN